MPAAAAALFACLASAPAASAAAGTLDPSFSDDGRLSLVAAGPFVARAVAPTADGGAVVAGYSCAPDPASDNGICRNDGDSSFRLARFTTDGGLDSEFGDKGLVTTQVGVARSQAFDLLVQPDGRIVVGGVARDQTGNGGRDTFALVRYAPNGAVDRTFGDQGVRLTRVGTGFAAIADLAAAPDGSVVAVGQGYDGENRARMAIARYTADGALDTAGFNAPSGYSLAGAANYNYGLGAATFGDGAILATGIAGASADPAEHRFSAVRLRPNGTLETDFDADGAAEYAVGTSSSFANAAAVRPDGTWLAAGAATDGDGRQVMAVLRGVPAGSLDSGWDGDGVALTRTGDGSLAHDLLLLGDGRAVAVGQAATGDGFAFSLARYTAAGALDPAFGSGGTATTPWANFPVARGTAGALLPDGRLLVTGVGCQGGSGSSCTGGTAVLLIARYLSDPPPAPAPPGSPPPPAVDTRAPFARFVGLSSKARRAGLLRRGLRVRVAIDEEASVSAAVYGRGRGRRVVRDRRGATRRFAVLLGRQAVGVSGGVRELRLRVRAAAVRRVRRFSVRVVVTVRDRAGNERTVRRTVRVR